MSEGKKVVNTSMTANEEGKKVVNTSMTANEEGNGNTQKKWRRQRKRISYVAAMRHTFQPPEFPGLPFREPQMINGQPIVVFTKEEVRLLCVPFRWTLVGKFSKGRPSLFAIHDSIKSFMDGVHNFHLSELDQKHVLIRFPQRIDFVKAYINMNWWIKGKLMRVFRYSPHFTPGRETSIAPVWVTLPNFRLDLFSPSVIEEIGDSIGGYVCNHEEVARFAPPGCGGICVEVDLAKPIKSSVILTLGEEKLFQKVEVITDSIPPFCINCKLIGHVAGNCRSQTVSTQLESWVEVLTLGNTESEQQQRRRTEGGVGRNGREQTIRKVEWVPKTKGEAQAERGGIFKTSSSTGNHKTKSDSGTNHGRENKISLQEQVKLSFIEHGDPQD